MTIALLDRNQLVPSRLFGALHVPCEESAAVLQQSHQALVEKLLVLASAFQEHLFWPRVVLHRTPTIDPRKSRKLPLAVSQFTNAEAHGAATICCWRRKTLVSPPRLPVGLFPFSVPVIERPKVEHIILFLTFEQSPRPAHGTVLVVIFVQFASRSR